MDELKKYLQHHADELNLDEPRPQVWQHIRQEVSTGKKTNVVMLVTRWAVAACVLALAGIGIWSLVNKQQPAAVPGLTVTNTKGAVNNKPAEQPSVGREILPTVSQKDVLASETKHTPKTRPVATEKADMRVLTDIETSFIQVINLQRARVSTMPMYAETPEYFNDFKVQIRSMEKDEKAIKSEISKHGMNDELLDQLINIYQQKLNVLKQLQIEMNKTNNRYKQNRGPVDSTRTYFLNI